MTLMKTVSLAVLGSFLMAGNSFAQSTFNITSTTTVQGNKVETGTDNYGNSIVRTHYPEVFNYAFEIDCNARGVSGEGSQDAMLVKFHMGSQVMQASQTSVFQREQSAPNCSRISDARYLVPNMKSKLPVTKVSIETSGSDAFFMDEINLQERTTRSWRDKITSSNGIITWKDHESRDSFRNVQHWGQDGGKGYCLSTNPAKPTGWENAVDGCARSMTFHVAGKRVTSIATQATLKTYAVGVKTSDIRRAGTDANIRLRLNGANGKRVGGTTGVLLNPKLSGNAFERNDLDRLNLSGQPDIGPIASITLNSDGNHPGADWNVAYVTVDGVRFNCGDREIEGAGSMTCGR